MSSSEEETHGFITAYHQNDFLARWKDIGKTIYIGNSIQELLNLCPAGCSPTNCASFPEYDHISRKEKNEHVSKSPCTEDDIVVLRKAQEIARDWRKVIKEQQSDLILHLCVAGIVIILIVVLIIRGHYRFRDLWILPSDRQWQSELDPTWGLPGKVWSLLKIRVVKSQKTEPTERKYLSYTESPAVMGEKFWYYKHALRDMYKTHKYYKRNRYFHKLAWQITKLHRLVPETLRKHKKVMRRAGEVEGARSPEPEADPQALLPWEIDLPDELNQVYLRKAKEVIKRQVEKDKHDGIFVCGRYPAGHQKQQQQKQHHHHHHHHHRRRSEQDVVLSPLGRDELEKAAKEMEFNPNADYVMVEGVMRLHPTTKKHHRRNRKKSKADKKEKKEKKDKSQSSKSKTQKE